MLLDMNQVNLVLTQDICKRLINIFRIE